MYQSADFTAASAPFVYRQVSAILTHALYLTGIFYPKEISFADPEIDQRMFFAACLPIISGSWAPPRLRGGLSRLGPEASPIRCWPACCASRRSIPKLR